MTKLIPMNVTILGRRTSIKLERAMMNALRDIAARESCTVHALCSLIHRRKPPETTLTAAIRVFLILYFRASSTDDGHRNAGHGDFNRMLRRARLPVEPPECSPR